MQYCSKCFCKPCLGSRFDNFNFSNCCGLSVMQTHGLSRKTGTGEDCSVQMGERKVPGPLPPPPPPPLHRPPPRRQRATGSRTTSAVCSAGRRMRSWGSFQPFPPFFMPTPTSPLSSRTTQVSVGSTVFKARTVQLLRFSEY